MSSDAHATISDFRAGTGSIPPEWILHRDFPPAAHRFLPPPHDHKGVVRGPGRADATPSAARFLPASPRLAPDRGGGRHAEEAPTPLTGNGGARTLLVIPGGFGKTSIRAPDSISCANSARRAQIRMLTFHRPEPEGEPMARLPLCAHRTVPWERFSGALRTPADDDPVRSAFPHPAGPR
jgi:hypothetical protein